jgi:acyl dehydratase
MQTPDTQAQGFETLPFVPYPPISLGQLKLYAEASGDNNPIHLDEKVAKSKGLPGIIAHGMLIAGLMSERALRFVEVDARYQGYRIKFFQTRFKAMVLLGDVLSIGGIIKETDSEELWLELQVKNQKDEITTVGIAKFSSD